MRVALLVLILAIVGAVVAQDNEAKTVIDNFTVDTPTLIIQIPAGGVSDQQSNLVDEEFVSGTGILGGERDVTLVVESGAGNQVLTALVSGRLFTSATPNQARGYSLLILDGPDASSNINYNGLNADLTFGEAYAIRTHIKSDQPTTVTFNFYSGSSSSRCSLQQSIPGDTTTHEYIIEFSRFTSGCTWSNIGAVEVRVEMNDNVDVDVSEITTWGPVDTCQCFCPQFTCRIEYDNDDASFTYFKTSDFNPRTTNTVSNTNSRTSATFSNGSNNSSASTVGISALLIAAVAALMF
jgi:hypothetical protein